MFFDKIKFLDANKTKQLLVNGKSVGRKSDLEMKQESVVTLPLAHADQSQPQRRGDWWPCLALDRDNDTHSPVCQRCFTTTQQQHQGYQQPNSQLYLDQLKE